MSSRARILAQESASSTATTEAASVAEVLDADSWARIRARELTGTA